MKGVILSRCPGARIVDITHLVPAGDVRAGAFALLTAYRFFPKGTVHVAVVDPGVGSDRRAIAARCSDATFVGPDNGLLSWALRSEKGVVVRRIENQRLFLSPVSATFHGRDVFAPVAAYLANGGGFAEVGPETGEWIALPWPEPARSVDGWLGEVVHVDHFGNAITNLPNTALEPCCASRFTVLCGRRRVPIGSCYTAVPKGRAVAVPGASGCIEIAVNGGNAARSFGLKRGAKVRLVAPGQPSRCIA
ncbi:MAG: SAM-dependent chlorinase/fluorinase [Verrucomicrobiota bacterium]|nr:SAM-dependent chlorinase/fluorinase [Verrucomicrobiota bacterium]